jgi:hypothetical protein
MASALTAAVMVKYAQTNSLLITRKALLDDFRDYDIPVVSNASDNQISCDPYDGIMTIPPAVAELLRQSPLVQDGRLIFQDQIKARSERSIFESLRTFFKANRCCVLDAHPKSGKVDLNTLMNLKAIA